METSTRVGGNSSPPIMPVSTATLAKGALRRLVMAQLEPTPENYTRAYLEEAGEPARPALPAAAAKIIERLMAESLDNVGPAAQAKVMQSMSRGKWDEASHLLDELVPRCRELRAAGESQLIEHVIAGIDRSSRHWTPARKKESLQRVLGSSRIDTANLHQKVRQLVASWDEQTQESQTQGPRPTVAADQANAVPVSAALDRDAGAEAAHGVDEGRFSADAANSNLVVARIGEPGQGHHSQIAIVPSTVHEVVQTAVEAAAQIVDAGPVWSRLLSSLSAAAQQGLPADDERCAALASEITALTTRIAAEGPTDESAALLESLCERAQKILQHRHQMLDQLGQLCHELTAGLSDLSEDASWARGQCDAMRLKLEEGLTPRGVRAVSGLLKATRERQLDLRHERETARTALRGLVTHMLHELDDLGAHTGRFHESVGRYADVIEQADSLEGLADVVRDMAAESRQVKDLMTETQDRLNTEHENATNLNARVSQLESELRRLSEEVSTDQLTQIANRRGLHQVFAVERGRAELSGKPLSIGLIDVDDFKRLNDKLGHNAGDEALKALAAKVRDGLRPNDTVARYGGEEFVVMLPETDNDSAVTVLTRLQRSLTAGLFMHNQQQIFVTFSAGVSSYRMGEALETTLDRADEALYEAKRTGKNRTCIS
ncbi:hypothetical protein BH09PSE5_BH09PSE5_39700 [soil metagenome]